MKRKLNFFEKMRRLLLSPDKKVSLYRQTREFKRWDNGWKKHCSSRSQIRRIGSRENAIKLGIIKK